MKKKMLKVLSVILSLCVVFSIATADITVSAQTLTQTTSAADTIKETFLGGFFAGLTRGVDVFINCVLNVLAALTPQTPGYTKLSEYESKNYFDGTDEFINEPSADATWSLGYAQRVLTPEDLLDRTYYMGGFDVANVITGKYDDIKVRCVCLDDGSGRGKTLFAVIDAVGISNSDIRGIREAFMNLAGNPTDIAAVNVSVTHTHSGIDTQGIWAVFGSYKSDFKNILKSMFPLFNKGETVSGVDKVFMQRVYKLSAEALNEAYTTMTSGDLYYAEKDATKYFRYRNDPSSIIGEISRFRFDPAVNHDDNADNDVMPTIITNFGCHPETVGYGGSVMSADFLPYMEAVMNDAGYNFLFIQGAIGAMITSNRHLSNDDLPDLSRYDTAVRQGEEYAYFVLGMTYDEQTCIDIVVDKEREANDKAALGDNVAAYTPWYENWQAVREEKLDPILNIAIDEVMVKIDNPVVKFIGKLGVTSNELIKDWKGTFYLVTEVGYLEMGKTVKVLMSPGETNPDFVLGGISMDAKTSTHRRDFQYDALCEYTEYFPEDQHLLVFDEMNDAAGYINPDNDYAIVVARYVNGEVGFNSNAMLFSLATNIGSTLIGTFLNLVKENQK